MPQISHPIPTPAMPLGTYSRRRSFFAESRIPEVHVEGEAYLCFAENFSSFCGSIETPDDSNFSVYGEKIDFTHQNKSDENNNTSKKHPLDEEIFNVKLTDHFLGVTYTLPNVIIRRDSTVFLSDDENQIEFRVHNVFKGQKADMIIQRELGSSPFPGGKGVVYVGIIKLRIHEELRIPGRQCWSL